MTSPPSPVLLLMVIGLKELLKNIKLSLYYADRKIQALVSMITMKMLTDDDGTENFNNYGGEGGGYNGYEDTDTDNEKYKNGKVVEEQDMIPFTDFLKIKDEEIKCFLSVSSTMVSWTVFSPLGPSNTHVSRTASPCCLSSYSHDLGLVKPIKVGPTLGECKRT
ncbi:hypothetical protein V6N13_115090 [Hibiscus sabdariffa]|uniref:Uncharacterized protein n=1 Tax=Hibiscus sabdariffa TaxID=183260 RepID=A0ABR2U3V4_9ROSI